MLCSMKNTTALNPALLEWSFADRLRKVRREVAEATQEEFAAALDVPLKAYGAWEAGRNTPREIVAIAKRIELVIGVPAAWMLGISDVAVPAATGTDGTPTARVTRRVTSEYVPGNTADVIQFPLVRKPRRGYSSKLLARSGQTTRPRTRQTHRHPNASAAV